MHKPAAKVLAFVPLAGAAAESPSTEALEEPLVRTEWASEDKESCMSSQLTATGSTVVAIRRFARKASEAQIWPREEGSSSVSTSDAQVKPVNTV